MTGIVRTARSTWSRKAREHAQKLRSKGLTDEEIGALMGRSAKSVEHALAGVAVGSIKSAPVQRHRQTYNRIEIASMLGMTIDDFMRHQIELEEDHGLPRSRRKGKYGVPRPKFDIWLKKREYPDLTPLQFAEHARAAFLRACLSNQPDKEINRAARILRVAEAVLAQFNG